ncbi:eclosion hormone [Drosophila takahashii]|uniref:eclosion hormone n=1 Tax=Drosophila takahashii TaxID=29030 RepID=UPI001CF92775|nr:eclosion hormone [Drosophila takahashii]
MNCKPLIMCTFVAVAVCLLHFGNAMPAINHYTHKRFDSMGGIDFIQVCLNNCVQCKTMLGDYFQGQTCALSCLKFKGKAIPDCEDIASIAPFLNALE